MGRIPPIAPIKILFYLLIPSVTPTLSFTALIPNSSPAMPISFTVRKQDPVLVAPAAPTPCELKPLSDIDNQRAFKRHVPGIHIYRNAVPKAGSNPAALIRAALSRALVFYYPLAGRLRELPGSKLAVDCTGEGVVFVEAEADINLHQLGLHPQPPFPCLDQLIHGDADFLTSPLLFMQLTRLSCGGLILTHQINHTVLDAVGLVQFLKAVAELAGGAAAPSVLPVWSRERLMAREPPRVTHLHPEYDQLPKEEAVEALDVVRSFFFGKSELDVLRLQLPPVFKCSRFELLTASLWRCRVAALAGPPGEEVRARFIINARDLCTPPLPAGFYGNAICFAVARTTARELIQGTLADTVELVRAAKNSITEGFLQSLADFIVTHGRPMYTESRTYRISDLTRLGFDEVDFGWGEVVYAGPALGDGRTVGQRASSYFVKYGNNKGEDGILVPVILPAPVMERFEEEIEKMVTKVREEICSINA